MSELVYDARKEGGFLLFFNKKYRGSREVFVQDLRKFGEFTVRMNSKPGGADFWIYLGAFWYKAYIHPDGQTGKAVGLNVNEPNPITQSMTMAVALRSTVVRGLSPRFAVYLGDPHSIDEHENCSAEAVAFFRRSQTRRDRLHAQAVDAGREQQEQENSERRRRLDWLYSQKDIVRAKEAFDATQLLQGLEYTDVQPVEQSELEGTVYRFVTRELTEEEIACLTDGKQLEISVNDGGFAAVGTVLSADADGLRIKLVNAVQNSFDRIAAAGVLNERPNKEHRYKRDAIDLLVQGEAPNAYLADLLTASRLQPYRETVPYTRTSEYINDSQERAIRMALNVEDFLLVQGPPGTGKTTIITEMVKIFARQGKRVLICSKNNLAVDNVLEKCMKLHLDEEKLHRIHALRLGREGKVIASVRSALKPTLQKRVQDNVSSRSKAALERVLGQEARQVEALLASAAGTARLLEAMVLFAAQPALNANFIRRLSGAAARLAAPKAERDALCGALEASGSSLAKVNYSLLVQLQKPEVAEGSLTLPWYSICLQTQQQALQGLLDWAGQHPFRSALALGALRPKALVKQAMACLPALQQAVAALEGYRGNYAEAVFPMAELPAQLNLAQGPLSAARVQAYREEIATRTQTMADKQRMLQTVLTEWHAELADVNESLKGPLLNAVPIVGATCIGVNSDFDFKTVPYDVAIVDEAGQITLHDLLVPLVKARKIILIGDHLQLPPSEEREFVDFVEQNGLLAFEEPEEDFDAAAYKRELGLVFGQSLFEKLFRDPQLASNRVMLDTQFRMHPDISEFISHHFYEDKYKAGWEAKDRTLHIAGFTRPIYFMDTCNMGEKRLETKNTEQNICINRLEADIIAEKLADIIVAINSGEYTISGNEPLVKDGVYDIGVITAYKKQIGVIRSALRSRLLRVYDREKVENILREEHLAINTLDSFQGRDNQIIFYSFVRSNRPKLSGDVSIGFLNEVRRLNVMMTRAKCLLVMVGDSSTLTAARALTVHDRRPAGHYFGALVDYCREKGGYIDMAKAGESIG